MVSTWWSRTPFSGQEDSEQSVWYEYLMNKNTYISVWNSVSNNAQSGMGSLFDWVKSTIHDNDHTEYQENVIEKSYFDLISPHIIPVCLTVVSIMILGAVIYRYNKWMAAGSSVKSKNGSTRPEKSTKPNTSNSVPETGLRESSNDINDRKICSCKSEIIYKLVKKARFKKILITCLVFCFLLTLPWEFMRLYQSAVAEKVAQMKTGGYASCSPDQMSVWQHATSLLRWHFSWAPDPCVEYHKALLVDPLWQVSPLKVFTSALSDCVVYPVEIILTSLGRGFRLFFNEIPTQWQPLMLIIIAVLMVLTLTMTFRYKIHLPFFLKFEPKTPVNSKTKKVTTEYNTNPEHSIKPRRAITDSKKSDPDWSIDSSMDITDNDTSLEESWEVVKKRL